jgi:hypothetical protein
LNVSPTDDDSDAYEPPAVEDLDSEARPAVTAAGIDSFVGPPPPPP